MDPAELEARGLIALRLKAARWLAGTISDGDKPRVQALSPAQLAERSPLPENGISAYLIGETERMERRARPMELQMIAKAIGVPYEFFVSGWLEAELPLAPPGEFGRRAQGSPTTDPLPGQDESQEEEDRRRDNGS